MRITDNHSGQLVSVGEQEDLKLLADRPLGGLLAAHPNLLLFPDRLGGHDDRLQDKMVCSLDGQQLRTYNIMGFIGLKNHGLTITSRFGKEQDYFLYYLLQKVFKLNIFDLPISAAPESIMSSLLIGLFPYYLKRALDQGLYKAYQQEEFNDAHVKGRIDLKKHLRNNTPFIGRIAYQTRAHTFDNRVNQLIRHTLSHIVCHSLYPALLKASPNLWLQQQLIVQSTPTYHAQARQQVIRDNSKPVYHPYYRHYEPLRKICLHILRGEGLSFGTGVGEVYGLLFDGAWLWEEYLDTLLAPLGFDHPQNNKGRLGGAVYAFTDDSYARYPDFYHRERQLVIDAKYKKLQLANLDRNDLHQLLAYLYMLGYRKGAFVFPQAGQALRGRKQLNGFGGELSIYGLSIPTAADSYADFCGQMAMYEADLLAFASLL